MGVCASVEACASLDQCYQAHLLLTLSLICGSAVWFAGGNRLFSKDNNFRNEYGSMIIPEDWLTDRYWGAWLVGEWVGVLTAGVGLVSLFSLSCHITPNTHPLPLQIVYYVVTPFFSNPGNVITRKQDDYEVRL